MLRILSVTFAGCQLGIFNIDGQCLEVSIGRGQLLVPVLEAELALFSYIHLHRGLAYTTAFWLVGFWQILSDIAIEATLQKNICDARFLIGHTIIDLGL